MPRRGRVLELNGERAWVSAERRGICDGCSDQASCSLHGDGGAGEPDLILVDNPLRARPGDTVEFDLPGRSELRVSLLVWTVPLAGLIAGAVAGSALHPHLPVGQDGATLLGAVAGFLASYAVLRQVDRRAARDERLVPRIVRIVAPSDRRSDRSPT